MRAPIAAIIIVAVLLAATAALGIDTPAVNALLASAALASLANAARWLTVISAAEEVLSGDPVGLKELVLDYLEGILSTIIILSLLALGLALSLPKP